MLLGARTVDQLSDTLNSIDAELDAADNDALTAVSAPGLPPHPYGIIEDLCHVDHWRHLGTSRNQV